MRLVPGMFVLQSQTTNYALGLRVLNPPMNNRVLCLLDGRQLSNRHTGALNLADFVISPRRHREDRGHPGPRGSTLYGANALTGVINITSKRPLYIRASRRRPGASLVCSRRTIPRLPRTSGCTA